MRQLLIIAVLLAAVGLLPGLRQIGWKSADFVAITLLFGNYLLLLWHQRCIGMKKYIVSMVFALSALMMLNGCIVSESKLTDKVKQAMVEFEQTQGNKLEVTDLQFEKSENKGYKGVLTGKLNGQDVTYDVTVSDAGNDFDVDWELRK